MVVVDDAVSIAAVVVVCTSGGRLVCDSPHVVDITYVRLLSGERKRVDGTIY